MPARQFGDEHVLADAGIDARDALDQTHKWHVRSTSPPPGLRSCLKSALAAAPPTSHDDEPSAPARPAKHVRIDEPSLVDELESLRERWASPEMQGEQGHGGIGGYRSTRDFVVARGKGAAAAPAAKPAPAPASATAAAEVLLPGKDIPATRADDDEAALEVEDDDAEPLARRLQRHHPRLSAHTSRTSSNSPSPLGRRRRGLSPASLHPSSLPARSSSPAFVVGHHSTAHKASPSRRRALSPNTATSPSSARSHSLSPGADRAAPRWVRTKGGKLASPAPVRWAVALEAGSGSEVEEETEEGEIEFEDAASDLEEDDHDEACPSPPRGISTQLAGIAAVAVVAPPLPPSASLHLVSPSGPASPALSVLSGGESPQESPTPSPARLPALAVTPSSPPAPVAQPLAPAPALAAAASPSPSSSAETPSSTSTAVSTASSSCPSPSIGAERRLSLRVEQALRDKHGKRHPSRELELQVGGGAGRASALTA